MATPKRIFCDFHNRHPEYPNRYFTWLAEADSTELGDRVVLSDDESLECVAIVIAKDYERARVEFRILSALRPPTPLAPHPNNGLRFTDVGVDDSDIPAGATVYA